MKKKAIKIATASAIAASAFVAAAPAQTDAASNVEIEVSKAVTQMKKAYHTYSDVTVNGEFANISDVYVEYNKAKDMYAAAKALVNQAGVADKDVHLATLQDTYADYIEKRVITYIDAYNYAQDLKDATAALNDAVGAGELDDAETAYHAVSKELRTRTAIFYRVYGKSTRDLFLNDFKANADSSVVEVREEVSVKMAYDVAEKALEEGNLEAAQEQFDKVAEFLANLDSESEFGKAISAKVEAAQQKFEELSVPAVESVSAINTKTLEVKFNKELTTEEQGKATYEVKVNGTVAPFKVESVAGDSVKLVRTNGLSLEAGSYEVTVKGFDADVTKSFTVEAQKATSLAVTASNVLDGADKSRVGLELKDQYGQALTINESDYTVTAYNVTQNATVTTGFDSTDKVFTIDTKTDADAFKVGDVIKVSFLHKASGLTTSKDLTVVAGAQLSGVTFGSVELPSGKTIFTEDLTNVKASYNAVDQYGNAVTLSADNVVVVSSDESIVDPADVTFISEGTPAVKKVQVAEFGGYGNVTLTFVNKVTGDVYRLPLEVKQEAGVISKVALEKSTLDIAQGGTDVAVGLNVTDNYDSAITASKYASGTAFTITSSNTSIATAAINNTPGDANYGKLVVSPEGTKGQKAVITVTVNATGETAKLNVTIGETAVASSINVDAESKHTTSLAVGASTTVDFKVFDQYANDVAASGDYKVVYSVKDAAEAITLTDTADGTADGVVNDASEDVTSVEVNAAKAGSATLVAKLVKGADEVIATKEVTFNVVANSGSKLTYALGTIPTLYKAGSIAGEDQITTAGTGANETIVTADVTAGYAKEVKVTAKDSSGNTVTIPASQIISVDSSSSNVLVGQVDGKYYVAGNNSGLDADAKATISVVYNAEDGVKTLTQEVTVSKDALKVTSVQFKDKAIGSTDAKDVTSLTVTNKAALLSVDGFGDAFIWAQDQFGGYTLADEKAEQDAVLSVRAVSGATGTATDTVEVETGLTGDLIYTDDSSDLAITAAGAKLRVIANFSGVAGSLDITVTNAD